MYKALDPLKLFHVEQSTPFKDGEVIFSEGDHGDCMYVVKSGSVALKHNNKLLETLKPGEIFGELALIDNEKRMASAQAMGDTELYCINEERFHFMIRQHPYFSQYVMKVMADRLRHILKHTE